MLLEEITMNEFEEGRKDSPSLIIPFGTVEAHGTHLPLSTDTLIINEIVRALGKTRGVLVAPPLHYGVCTSTSQHPGTIGITPETLRRVTSDLVRDGYAQGIRNFLLVSGHGGSLHVSATKEVAESLTAELSEATIAAFCIYELLPKEALEMAETKNDSHAGEFETSLVLYLAKGLVKGRAPEEYPALPKPIVARDKLKYWPGAVWGNPEKASIEKGDKLFEMLTEALSGLLDSVEGFEKE